MSWSDDVWCFIDGATDVPARRVNESRLLVMNLTSLLIPSSLSGSVKMPRRLGREPQFPTRYESQQMFMTLDLILSHILLVDFLLVMGLNMSPLLLDLSMSFLMLRLYPATAPAKHTSFLWNERR